MKILPVLTYPDPILKQTAEPVTDFDDELCTLIDDMIFTMLAAPGAGLAAPQVGVLKRLFVVNGEYFDQPNSGFPVINPVIVSLQGFCWAEEGCLSVPGEYAEVERAESVVIAAQDIQGKPVVYELEDLPARIFQHERDHLDGHLFFERMKGLKKTLFIKRIKRHAQSKTKKKTAL